MYFKSKFATILLKGQDIAFEPAKLLWLIQRDFLRESFLPSLLIQGIDILEVYSAKYLLIFPYHLLVLVKVWLQ
jgi:hypothetical protein